MIFRLIFRPSGVRAGRDIPSDCVTGGTGVRAGRDIPSDCVTGGTGHRSTSGP